MKSVTLCADDYAQNSKIAQGILQLIALRRLSATSCMTTSPYWQDAATPLSLYKDRVDIGLHFNLTYGKLFTLFSQPLKTLLIKAYCRQLNLNNICEELTAQLDSFRKSMGFEPHFIDGHEHIQQFPIIRQALIRVIQERYSNNEKPYIRVSTSPGMAFKQKPWPKAAIINLCGASAFKKQLMQLNIPHNDYFSGIYDFNQADNYQTILEEALIKAPNHTLIMCHPGLASQDPDDGIEKSRTVEYNYLASDDFNNFLKQHQIAIMPFRQI